MPSITTQDLTDLVKLVETKKLDLMEKGVANPTIIIAFDLDLTLIDVKYFNDEWIEKKLKIYLKTMQHMRIQDPNIKEDFLQLNLFRIWEILQQYNQDKELSPMQGSKTVEIFKQLQSTDNVIGITARKHATMADVTERQLNSIGLNFENIDNLESIGFTNGIFYCAGGSKDEPLKQAMTQLNAHHTFFIDDKQSNLEKISDHEELTKIHYKRETESPKSNKDHAKWLNSIQNKSNFYQKLPNNSIIKQQCCRLLTQWASIDSQQEQRTAAPTSPQI